MANILLQRLHTLDTWSVSSSSSLTTSGFSVVSVGSVFSGRSVLSVGSVLTSLLSLSLLLFPLLLGQKIIRVTSNGSLISGSLLLFLSWVLSQGDFNDGEESLLLDSNESLLSGLIHIGDLFLLHLGDLVETRNSSLEDLSDPKGSVHESIGCLDGDEGFSLPEEESEGSADISAWITRQVP